MIKLTKYSLSLFLFVFASASSHAGYESAHANKIEMIASNIATPKDIRVEKTDSGIVITGIIKHLQHSSRRLRGYVKVELINNSGSILASERKKIYPKNFKVHRAQFARFKIIIPMLTTKPYRIRVSHVN